MTRDYELGRHLASAGPGLLWKVHAGVKKTSKQEVCIFVFDKKAPELEKLPKKQKEQIFDMLKKVCFCQICHGLHLRSIMCIHTHRANEYFTLVSCLQLICHILAVNLFVAVWFICVGGVNHLCFSGSWQTQYSHFSLDVA